MLITYDQCDKLIMHGNMRHQVRVFTHKLSIFHKPLSDELLITIVHNLFIV